MCMEDIRIGRRSFIRQSLVTIPAAEGLILAGDANRVGVLFRHNNTVAYFVSPGRRLAPSFGLYIANNFPQEVWRVEDWGNAIYEEWYGVSSGVAVETYIMEVILLDR